MKNTPLPLLTFQNVCAFLFVLFLSVSCCLMPVFLAVRVAFAGFLMSMVLLFVAVLSLLSLSLSFLLLLLLLLGCCCCCGWVPAAAAGAFKSPTVEKRIFARFYDFPKCFCRLFCYLCCCVAAVCSTCCFLHGLLLLLLHSLDVLCYLFCVLLLTPCIV